MSVENWNEPIEETEVFGHLKNPEVVRVLSDGSAVVMYRLRGLLTADVFPLTTACWRNVPKPEPKRETVEEVRKEVRYYWTKECAERVERMARAVFHEEMGRVRK